MSLNIYLQYPPNTYYGQVENELEELTCMSFMAGPTPDKVCLYRRITRVKDGSFQEIQDLDPKAKKPLFLVDGKTPASIYFAANKWTPGKTTPHLREGSTDSIGVPKSGQKPEGAVS